MKKLIYSILTFLALTIIAGACSGDSYQKRLDKQKKAIRNFLSDNQIETLTTYPSNHKFEKNQYYLEGKTGVYLRVESMGDTENPLTEEDRIPVYVRYDSVKLMSQGYYTQGNNSNAGMPVKFTYGDNSTYIDHISDDINTMIMSPSLVLALEKGLGNGAVVSMIVPFVNGSSYQMNYYEPFYFPYIRYTYHK